MSMHLVAGLEGALLDAAVAKAEGMPEHVVIGGFAPHKRWHDAGPIIERERISLMSRHSSIKGITWWHAQVGPEEPENATLSTADTPLVAAMRAYVASKFGAEVEL